MKLGNRCKCLHCRELFLPDYRNRRRQRHCRKPPCRKVAKAESQRRWLARPENQLYFRGAENVRRVQEWRRRHPGYWRHKKPAGDDALQDRCPGQAPAPQAVAPSPPPSALQDLCSFQPAVLVGLISVLTGSALQEDIARTARSFFTRGQDILGCTPAVPFVPSYENQTPPLPSTVAARAAPV